METAFAEGIYTCPLEGEPFICTKEVIANFLLAILDEEVPH